MGIWSRLFARVWVVRVGSIWASVDVQQASIAMSSTFMVSTAREARILLFLDPYAFRCRIILLWGVLRFAHFFGFWPETCASRRGSRTSRIVRAPRSMKYPDAVCRWCLHEALLATQVRGSGRRRPRLAKTGTAHDEGLYILVPFSTRLCALLLSQAQCLGLGARKGSVSKVSNLQILYIQKYKHFRSPKPSATLISPRSHGSEALLPTWAP